MGEKKAKSKKDKDKDRDNGFHQDMEIGEAKSQFRKSLDTKGPAVTYLKTDDGLVLISPSIPSSTSVSVITGSTADGLVLDDFGSSDPGRKAVRPDKDRVVANEMKHFIHNVEVKYEIADPNHATTRFNNYDGVFWKDRVQKYFKGQPNWPPNKKCGFFWTKGYYKDWSDARKGNFNFWTEQKGNQDNPNQNDNRNFEDEDAKIDRTTMMKVKAARELGLKDANDWESYDSISDDGNVKKKYRRKSMKKKQPELYKSHAARKADREQRKKYYLLDVGKKRDSQIHIKDPQFILDLAALGSKLDSMNEKDIAKYLVNQDLPNETPSELNVEASDLILSELLKSKKGKAKKDKKGKSKKSPPDESTSASAPSKPETEEIEVVSYEVIKKPKKPKKNKGKKKHKKKGSKSKVQDSSSEPSPSPEP